VLKKDITPDACTLREAERIPDPSEQTQEANSGCSQAVDIERSEAA